MNQSYVTILRKSTTVFLALLLGLSLVTPAEAQKNNRKRQGRPISLGTSGGNIEAFETERENGRERTFCVSGTLGSLIKQGNQFVILSTNNAVAVVNRAERGEEIVQPGLLDNKCKPDEGDTVGELSDFKKITFEERTNTVDLALVKTTKNEVKKSGDIIGIGVPGKKTKKAKVGMAVKKSGAGTGVTVGEVYLDNATIEVAYRQNIGIDWEFELAIYKKQLLIVAKKEGKKIYGDGDSGALVVEDKKNCPAPIGLAFAGNDNGDAYAANKIDEVIKQAKKLKPKGTKKFVGCSGGSSAQSDYDPAVDHALQMAERVQRRVEHQMLALRGVVGIGSRVDAQRRPTLVFLVARDDVVLRDAIPAEIDGVGTEVLVTGYFFPY